MNYVGIDWAYGRAAFCAMTEAGAIASEGLIPADQDGLARLVLKHGTEVKACVEMMSGAVWVRDQLDSRAGRSRSPMRARSATSPHSPARPTRSTPGSSPSFAGATWSRRYGSHRPRTGPCASCCDGGRTFVKARTSHRNRIFGLLTQFGLRISLRRLRQPDVIELLIRRGVPEVWRASIAEHLAEIDHLDRRISPMTASSVRSRALIPERGCCRRSRASGR